MLKKKSKIQKRGKSSAVGGHLADIENCVFGLKMRFSKIMVSTYLQCVFELKRGIWEKWAEIFKILSRFCINFTYSEKTPYLVIKKR